MRQQTITSAEAIEILNKLRAERGLPPVHVQIGE